MGVDIGISDGETAIYPRRDEPLVTLEDDGYFWFLYPFFEDLARETGKWICLYEAPVFCGPTLKVLRTALGKAKRSIKAKPDIWKVCIGTQSAPVKKKLYSTVHKKTLLSLLRKIDQIVAKAIATNRCVTFFGD